MTAVPPPTPPNKPPHVPNWASWSWGWIWFECKGCDKETFVYNQDKLCLDCLEKKRWDDLYQGVIEWHQTRRKIAREYKDQGPD